MSPDLPERPPLWPGYEVDTDRIRLFVRRSGPTDAPKVVLLHGWAVHGGMFQWMRDGLEDRFDLIVPDLRGHGLSDAPRRGYTPTSLAEDLRALLDALDVPRAHILGYSLGGLVALALALNHPERVARLGLMCTTARQGSRRHRAGLFALERIFRLAPPQAMGAVSRHLLSGPGLPSEMGRVLHWLMRHNSRAGLSGGARMLRAAQLEAGLATIEHPTLVVTAGRDVAIRAEDGQHLVDTIPGAQHRHFEDAGHGLAASHPKALNRCIRDFLDAGSDRAA